MMRRTRSLPGLIVALAAAVALVGCDVEPEPADDLDLDRPTPDDTLDDQFGQQPQQEIYEARLEERNGSGVTGTATLTMEGDELQVTIAATGLDPDTRVPQHIHMNASCDDAGGILLNLDDDLSAAGESEPSGDAYPEADDEGRLTYEASRSADDMRTAMGDQAAAGEDALDLTNRVVNLHGEDMQPIACGEIESMEAAGGM